MDENKRLSPAFIIYADGRRLDPEHEGALKSIRINDSLNNIAKFSLTFDISKTDIIEKGLIIQNSEISIHLGYKDNIEEIFSGYVTGFHTIFSEYNSEQLLVNGRSFLNRLDQSIRSRSFEKSKPSDIIKKILDEHSLKAEVDDFGEMNEFSSEEDFTDYAYLKYMTEFYGKQFYAYGNTVYIKDEITVRNDEIILEWGKSLISFDSLQDISKSINGVDVIGWDRLKGESFLGKATLDDIPVKIGGNKNWSDVTKRSGNRHISQFTEMGVEDSNSAKKIAIGQLQNSSYSFYSAYGKCEGNYKLHPGMRVMIKNTDKISEGEYIAHSVYHTLSKDSGYITEFELIRNMYDKDYLRKKIRDINIQGFNIGADASSLKIGELPSGSDTVFVGDMGQAGEGDSSNTVSEENKKIIIVNAYIVDGTGWDEQLVNTLFSYANTIFNNNKINVTFQCKISIIKSSENLTTINAIRFHVDEIKGYDIITNQVVNLYSHNTYIFTNKIYDGKEDARGIVTNQSNTVENSRTVIIAKHANNSTLAHEIGHLYKLKEETGLIRSRNLMDQMRLDPDDINQIILTDTQIQTLKRYMQI